MVPDWLHSLALASLALAFLCAMAITFDALRHPQKMWIMNLVWPLTALFGSVIWTWGYWKFGRLKSKTHMAATAKGNDQDMHHGAPLPFPVMVAKGASHCGAGCTLGDIIAELVALGVPAIAVLFGWHSLFADKIFAVWVLDYVLAYLFGIVFQFFTIAPMRHLGVWQGLIAAIKADTLSLTAWQVGMYAFMAFANFVIFRRWLGVRLDASMVEFWFMMQIAMICGFITSYPVNWWLLKAGLKEKM